MKTKVDNGILYLAVTLFLKGLVLESFDMLPALKFGLYFAGAGVICVYLACCYQRCRSD